MERVPPVSWLPAGDHGSLAGNFRVFLEKLHEPPGYSEEMLLERFMKWGAPPKQVEYLSTSIMEKNKELKIASDPEIKKLKGEVKKLKTELLKGTLFKNLMEVEAWESEAEELMEDFLLKKLEAEIKDLNQRLHEKVKEIELLGRQKEELESQLAQKNREMVCNLQDKNTKILQNSQKQSWLKAWEMDRELAEKTSELALHRKQAAAEKLRLEQECDALRSNAKQAEEANESSRNKLREEESKCGELHRELLEISSKAVTSPYQWTEI